MRAFVLLFFFLHPYQNDLEFYYLTDELCAGKCLDWVLTQANHQEKKMISYAFPLPSFRFFSLYAGYNDLSVLLDLLSQVFVFPLPSLFSHLGI